MSTQLTTAIELANLRVQLARINVIGAMMGYAPASQPADPRAQWEAAIAARTARGMQRYQAIVDIGRTDRNLYETYNKEAN